MGSSAPPQFIVNWRNNEIAERIGRHDPLDWTTVFGNSHPVDLEIGIGNGSFMVPFLADRPERNMIGIETEVLYLRKADRHLARLGLTNGRLLVGDAKLLVWRLIAQETICDVYVNYPDPWFKKRHVKRRLLNPGFLQLLAARMTGVLTVATDDEEYKNFVLASTAESGCLEPVFENGYVHSLDGYYETKYERKWKSAGKTCYYMKFRKTSLPVLDSDEYAKGQHLEFVLSKFAGSVIENQRRAS